MSRSPNSRSFLTPFYRSDVAVQERRSKNKSGKRLMKHNRYGKQLLAKGAWRLNVAKISCVRVY